MYTQVEHGTHLAAPPPFSFRGAFAPYDSRLDMGGCRYITGLEPATCSEWPLSISYVLFTIIFSR